VYCFNANIVTVVLKSGHKPIVLGDLKSCSKTMKAKALYKHMAGGTEKTHEKSQA
jgi:hypothetical protein